MPAFWKNDGILFYPYQIDGQVFTMKVPLALFCAKNNCDIKEFWLHILELAELCHILLALLC